MAVVLTQASCSFVFVESAPRSALEDSAATPAVVSCTRRRTAPIIDIVTASGALLVTLAGLVLMGSLNSSDPDSPFYDNGPSTEDELIALE